MSKVISAGTLGGVRIIILRSSYCDEYVVAPEEVFSKSLDLFWESGREHHSLSNVLVRHTSSVSKELNLFLDEGGGG